MVVDCHAAGRDAEEGVHRRIGQFRWESSEDCINRPVGNRQPDCVSRRAQPMDPKAHEATFLVLKF